MFLRSLLAASAFTLQASAFLVPLEVSQVAKDPALKHQVVELDCPGCPFASYDDEGLFWTQSDRANSIHLEFDITDDDQFLQINGQPIFPPPKTLIPIALKASQIQTTDGSQTEPLRLGYALEVLPPVSEVTDIALTPMQFTILDLQGVPVQVDTVRVDLLQSSGHLHIARITRMPYSESPGADQCTTSVCRLRAIIANRLRKMVESAKAHAGKAKTWIKHGCPGRKHAQAAADQDGKKSHHHVHHGHGRLHHLLKQTVHFFLLPALFGVAGGLVACAFGMLVGQALASCMNRRSRREGARVLEVAVGDDEKDALVENGEMPPQYEDVDVIVIEQK